MDFKFYYDFDSDTYLYGDKDNGIGLFFDKITTKWCGNIVVDSNIYFAGEFESYILAESTSIEMYKKMRG